MFSALRSAIGSEILWKLISQVRDTLEHSSKLVFCFRVIFHSILAFGASD